MNKHIAKPADVFFYDESHSLCASPYSLPLRSGKDIAGVCNDKKVLFISGRDMVSERLSSAFRDSGVNVQTIELQAGSARELKGLLPLFSDGETILILAFREYQRVLTNLCSVISKPMCVVLPTGFLILAAPQARYEVPNGACVSYADLPSMLSRFAGKRLLLWNHGPTAKYDFLPVLKQLDMVGDVVGMVDEGEGSFALKGDRLRARPAGEWVARTGAEAVLIAHEAAASAFEQLHSWLPDCTPLLMHASRLGVLDAFHSVAMTHSLFTGEDGLLRSEKVSFAPSPPLSKERYALLHEGYPNRSDEHYECITTWSMANLFGSGFSPADMQSAFVNCADGLRRTAFQPDTWDASIHVFGASNAFGAFVDDESTVASQLQKHCVKAYEESRLETLFKVVNFGTNASSPDNCFRKLCHAEVKTGDHIIFLTIPYWPRVHPDSFTEVVNAMHQRCLAAGAFFSVFLCPELLFSVSPSPDEQKIISDFQGLIGEIGHNREYPVWSASCYEDVFSQLRNDGIVARTLQPHFERPHDLGEIFIDVSHVSHKGQELIADVIFENVIIARPKSHVDLVYERGMREYARVVKDVMLSNESFVSFLEKTPRIDNPSGKRIGAVVVNCNPFTLGHRHLVESALEQVDYLYIFVVEEDKSFYSTAQRFEMVRAGVKEFGERVIVGLGGPGIISSITFSEYFTKEDPQDSRIDAGVDGLVFGSIISREFGIKTRFFGEEPSCVVTNEYMRQLQDILPLYGVECNIIPRLESNGAVISASRVRPLYQEHDWCAMHDFVPESTLRHLKKYSGEVGGEDARQASAE